MRNHGTYRRLILIAGEEGRVSVDVEDDGHRFGVDLRHDGRNVTGIAGRALRTPWSSCGMATAMLDMVVGTPLRPCPFTVLRQFRLRDHCTHLIDMAALGVMAAANGVAQRRYEIALDVETDGDDHLRLGTFTRDSAPPVEWAFRNGLITAPSAYAGLEVGRSASWVHARESDPERIEMIFVAQRAYLVAAYRLSTPDDHERASDVPGMSGACFTFQADRAAAALPNPNSRRDFADRPEVLLADLDRPAGYRRGSGPSAH